MSVYGTMFEPLKYILIISVFVILLSYIESVISKNTAECMYNLNKDILKINPPCIQSDMYLYVINKSQFNTKNIFLGSKQAKLYKKTNIPVHISESIKHPFDNAKNSFKHIFSSSTPINDMFTTISSLSKIKDVANPLSSSIVSDDWIIVYPNKIKLNCFIDNHILYFNK